MVSDVGVAVPVGAARAWSAVHPPPASTARQTVIEKYFKMRAFLPTAVVLGPLRCSKATHGPIDCAGDSARYRGMDWAMSGAGEGGEVRSWPFRCPVGGNPFHVIAKVADDAR